MKKYRMPAEWERQSMVQLTWPHKDTDWAPMLGEITETYVEMAREITRREPLLIVVPSRRDLPEEVLRMEHVTIFECPTDDTWARDHGFITLVERGVRSEECGANILLDFKFNGWGEKFGAEKDNAINRKLWEAPLPPSEGSRESKAEYESHLDFVLEGGSIESDGKGTIFTTTCCLLAPNRNESRGSRVEGRGLKEWIDSELRRRLRAERIVWLDAEPMEGDDTDGHIDTMVRIGPNDTLLYNRDEGMRQQLEELRTLDGNPYRLIELPLPYPIYDNVDSSLFTLHSSFKEQLPATYANFLIINEAVLVPTYGQPDNDAEAMRLIASAFPDREIVGIDSSVIIKQHGSIHCCTMQYY